MAVIRVPSEFPSISAAVASASSGDTILVRNGVYKEAVVVPLEKPSIRIIADGKKVILDGQNRLASGFTILTGNIEIKGFTIRNYVSSGIRITTPLEPFVGQGNKLIGNHIANISKGDGIVVIGTFATLVWRNRITGVRGIGMMPETPRLWRTS